MEQGLLSAMLEQRYEDITVSGLCDRMGVPRKSFYRYFDSKEDALHALLDHTLMDYEGYIPDGKSAWPLTIEEEIERYFDYWLSKKPLLDALSFSGLSSVLSERALAQVQESLPLLQRRMSAETNDEEREYMTVFATGGILTLMIRWHHMGCPVSPKHMAHIIARFLSQPLFER
ncbi:MAG: TetR/AcrR family transcriptional regulator [Oscillospiraceae bacterium]|nr:TetR/AcrR family transcriptional regulator [Oscillospiraceae bacterium]